MNEIQDSKWREDFDKFDFFCDYELLPENDWSEQEIWEQAGTGFAIVFEKDGSWAIDMSSAENDYLMKMPDELVSLIQSRSKAIKELNLE